MQKAQPGYRGREEETERPSAAHPWAQLQFLRIGGLPEKRRYVWCQRGFSAASDMMTGAAARARACSGGKLLTPKTDGRKLKLNFFLIKTYTAHIILSKGNNNF